MHKLAKLLTDADKLTLERHAQIIERMANSLLEMKSVLVTYAVEGKKVTPLDKAYVDQIVRGQTDKWKEEFLRQENGQIEWILDPRCHPFNPDDPSAVWYYSNSFFRLHQSRPFTEADVTNIITEVSRLQHAAPEICEKLICILSVCMNIALGLIPPPKTYLVSVRPSQNFECLSFHNGYWYNGLCSLSKESMGSNIVASFTPYLDADKKGIPKDADNLLSPENRQLCVWLG